jgi:CheY-like chemotaxis protein
VSTNPRVLVIDDDEIVREVMCDLLRTRGCEVFDSGSAIGVTRTVGEQNIDVVVLDVMMPGLSGDKLAKLLRENPRMPMLTIVLVSGTDSSNLEEIAMNVKADAVVSKSDIHRELAMVVVSAHRRRALARTATR